METRNLAAEQVAAARRRQLGRRAKRGVVAGYIHGLSVRHQHGGGPAEPSGATWRSRPRGAAEMPAGHLFMKS